MSHVIEQKNQHFGRVWPVRSFRAYLFLGALIGGFLGALDAAQTLLGGYSSTQGLFEHLRFFLWSSVAISFVGVSVGFLIALFGLATKPLASFHRQLFAFFIASSVGICAFLYIFHWAPFFGVPLAGTHGFFKPVTRGMVFWFAISLGLILVTFLFLQKNKNSFLFLLVWIVVLPLLYLQLTVFLYADSKAWPLTLVHDVTLWFFVLLLVWGLNYLVPAKGTLAWVGDRVQWPISLLCFAALYSISVYSIPRENNRVRLSLHQRSALAFRVLKPLARSPGIENPFSDSCSSSVAKCGSQPEIKRAIEAQIRPPIPVLRGVVFVLFDALRADRLGAQRDDVTLMSNFEEMADRGWSFSRAYATYPATSTAVASILTSLSLFDGVQPTRPFKQSPWLGTWLKNAGVKSIAISSHPTVTHLVEGFDIVDTSVSALPDLRFALTSKFAYAAVVAHIDDIKEGDRFFFLVHLYDTHGEFVPNPKFDFGFKNMARYDAEVAYADYWMGRIRELFMERFGEKNIAFLASADHGEEFFDHRYAHHGHQLYDESIRVPLVIDSPGLMHRTITEPVSGVDIGPTVLDLLGLPLPDGVDGISLLRLGTAPDLGRIILSHIDDRRAILRGPLKLIWNKKTDIVELYNLDVDPKEKLNLADENPEICHQLFCAHGCSSNPQ